MCNPHSNTIIKLDKQRKYRYTKKGLFTDLYTGTRSSSKKRGHPEPAYNKLELVQWLEAQPRLTLLYEAWAASGYDRKLKPSIDRLDNTKPYVFDNMQLITWYDNVLKQ